MNKTIKLVSILLMVAMLLVSLTTVVSATDADTAINNLFTGQNYDAGGISGIGKNIINIISTIGIVVAVVVLLILGIKYMIGSASEKAEYKKTMIPYLVGAVLIFGASAITQAVVSMAGSIVPE